MNKVEQALDILRGLFPDGIPQKVINVVFLWPERILAQHGDSLVTEDWGEGQIYIRDAGGGDVPDEETA